MKNSFGQILLSHKLIAALSDMGFEEPTPIQAQAIPLLMEDDDIIGQAQTGTGKTAAFGIPIIEKINNRIRKVQAIILTPTRELAIQVADEINKISKYKRIKVLPVYGGQPIDRQIRALHMGVHIVIGTPGRILDHINRNTLKLNNVNFAVLDEADEMLDMGFIEDIELILKNTPQERQTMLFSATMPKPIQRLAEKYLHKPKVVSISRENLTVPLIQQNYYEVEQSYKLEALCRILDYENYDSAIVFCRTKRGVDELTANLQTRGYFADGLHGDLTQAQRDKAMKMFRHEETDILVATDVAARGLDIDRVSHVINFDIPQDPESYVHRIGRTGRAGRAGKALTLIIPKEYKQLRLIEKLINYRIEKSALPTFQDIVGQQKNCIKDSIIELIEDGLINEYKDIASEIMKNYSALDVAAACLKHAFSQRSLEIDEIDAISHGFGNTGARRGMVRLFLTIGRQHKIRPHELVKIISEETGISAKSIGDISIFDKFTFLEVPEEVGLRVINIMDRLSINGKRITVQLAKAR